MSGVPTKARKLTANTLERYEQLLANLSASVKVALVLAKKKEDGCIYVMHNHQETMTAVGKFNVRLFESLNKEESGDPIKEDTLTHGAF